MGKTDIFNYLDTPLNNTRWSWGAVRQRDGAVFLLVWQDEDRRLNRKHYTCVNAAAFFDDYDRTNLGNAERRRHIELIRAGATAYMLMCLAVDTRATPRKIASINEREVFVGGELIEMDGDWWLERVERRPIDLVR